MAALQDVGGRLVPAASAFLRGRSSAPCGGGAAGVRWLANELELHLDHDGPPMDDHGFVEGAGALLGLLLIDHLGGRAVEHGAAHRVQIGRFGWFDPFQAIEEALLAEEPRRCLAEYLDAAEREASGQGAISRVVRLFSLALEETRPELRIDSQRALTVDLSNGASVDLTRLVRIASTEDDVHALEAARRIIGMLSGSATQALTTWDEAGARILPRLVSEGFLRSLPGENVLFAEPLGADVYLALQLRYDGRSRYVARAEIESWAVAHEQAKQKAVANLIARSRSVGIEQLAGGVMRMRQGDGLDAARLLLPDLAVRLAPIVDGGLWLAAAPHRDALLLGGNGSAQELAAQAEDAFRRAPHPISATVFRVTAEGLLPL